MDTASVGSGQTWAYERHGSRGPLVVLAHGLMFDHRIWQPVVEDLAADHQVLTVDLPGHGASPPHPTYDWQMLADELADLVDRIQPSNARQAPVLVGHSAAALLVTVYAAGHPVRAVVDVDQPLDIREFADRLRQIGPDPDQATLNLVIELLVASMQLDAVPEPYRPLVVPHPDPDALVGWQRPLRVRPAAEIQDWVEQSLAAIEAPFLAVFSREPWAGHDEWLAQRTRDARVEVYGCAGHFPHLADPARFSASIRALTGVVDR